MEKQVICPITSRELTPEEVAEIKAGLRQLVSLTQRYPCFRAIVTTLRGPDGSERTQESLDQICELKQRTVSRVRWALGFRPNDGTGFVVRGAKVDLLKLRNEEGFSHFESHVEGAVKSIRALFGEDTI
jgi:hypothetical protein